MAETEAKELAGKEEEPSPPGAEEAESPPASEGERPRRFRLEIPPIAKPPPTSRVRRARRACARPMEIVKHE